MTETSLEHVDLFAELIILELVLFCLSANLLIALLSQTGKLALLGVFELIDHFVRLVKLHAQILDKTFVIYVRFFAVGFLAFNQLL